MRFAAVLICLVLVFGFGTAWAGDLEPSAPPGPTMKSLDEIAPTWSQILDSTDGEPDGCNSSRFKCVLNDEAVLDMETGLVWQRSPDAGSMRDWESMFLACLGAETGGRCGWRLPNAEEFRSLVDGSPGANASLPESHPFTGIQEMTCHHSATTDLEDPTAVWGFGCSAVNGGSGCGVCAISKSASAPRWCVRGGRGDASP